MAEIAKLILGDQTYEYPVITGTEKEKAIDISKLRSQTGHITLDNGLGNTGSCLSSITFLNGEKGILKYRGIGIESLASKSHFLEVAYLLINGTLPKQSELRDFEKSISAQNTIPQGIQKLIESFPKTAHPMAVLSAAVVGLAGYNEQFCKPILDDGEKKKVFAQLLGVIKIIAANFYRHTLGLTPVTSVDQSSYCADFLSRMNGEKISQEVVKALDILLILHADHEQNCSASTVRVVGSGQGNVYGSIAAGINALWGPLHGGANQAVIEMLDAIAADGGDYKKYLLKAKDKNDSFRLMGFGHRVYKNFDPRAKIIKTACDSVLKSLGVKDPVLDIAKGLEEAALTDSYFVERKLYPNVDFYSGIIYRALKIPTNMFTVLFAIGRLPGWLAQWKELVDSDDMKITRPRQIFTGETQVEYTPISSR